MPPKLRSALTVLPPYARSLVEQVEQVHRLLQLLTAGVGGRAIVDLDVPGSLAFQEEPTALVIASGVIDVSGGTGSLTSSQSAVQVDTEGAAASDILHTINGGRDGMVLVLRATNAARTIVVENGTGNIVLPADVSLDTNAAILVLWYNSTLSQWLSTPRPRLPLTTKTANYTATTLDHIIRCDPSSGAFTLALPPTAGLSGFDLYIINVSGSVNAVTVDGDGAETINEQLTWVLGAHDAIHIATEGSNWDIM